MRARALLSALVAVATIGSIAAIADAQQHAHSPTSASGDQRDARIRVQFPEAMRLHTLANMRDHLLSLQKIDVALARGAFEDAANVAETRLGMSSLEAHGAAHLAPYMPKGMQEMGTQMHRAASRFAVEAQNAAVGNDVRPALAALGDVMAQCVACHAAYRLH
jgi:cytochrome c556